MLSWLILSVLVVIVFLVLQSNQANLAESPGIAKRLKVFLTTHKAEINLNPVLPELRSPHYSVPPDELLFQVMTAMEQLGWQQVRQVKPGIGAKAIVVTPLWRFKDDVKVEIVTEGDGSSLRATSKSRIGRADFAANSAHLQCLLLQIATNLSNSDQ